MGRWLSSPCLRRLLRNIAQPGIPEPLAPSYAECSDEELIEAVSLVVTVKDTCAQAEELLTHLSKMFPRNMSVYYAYPNIRGCRHVPSGHIGQHLFTNFNEMALGANDAPLAGFLKVQPLLQTRYAVLMHNDAYPMERAFACEMYRALEANPHYPIAAPQIYETGGDKLIVPHGHHKNLHVRPSVSGQGYRIDYDLSLDLLTQRKPEDFQEGPQMDFLEGHAFFARSDRYHELLDPSGSFTLEYMDMILNMRARNTSVWYVPTARCLFNVDTTNITWEDLPYLVYKRSEQVGHQVRTYLTKKWGVEFVNTGIWNYVRYVMLHTVVLEREGLPRAWEDQAAIFYSWFESVGFNRYDGRTLPSFIEEPSSRPVRVSRTQQQELPTDVPEDRVPPKSAMDILPMHQRKKAGAIDISFENPHMLIGIQTSSCNASDPTSYAICGLAVQDGDACTCWNYAVPFNLETTLYIDKLMEWMKLPSRAFTYAQMKFWTMPIDEKDMSIFCEPTQENCELLVHFSSTARVLQWSWFGKVAKGRFTFEGIVIFSNLMAIVVATVVVRSSTPRKWLSVKKWQLLTFMDSWIGLCA